MSNVKLLQAILDKVKSMDNKVDEVKQELEKTETRLTSRIDKLGLQIANFEDDAQYLKASAPYFAIIS